MPDAARPVLIFAPLEGDAAVLAHVVESRALRALVCRKLDAFAEAMAEEPLCAIISHEGAGAPTIDVLSSVLQAQPAWSTIPLIFAVRDAEKPPPACRALIGRTPPASIVILQRPVRRVTLDTVLQNQLLLRRRQLETGELLQKLEEGERYQKFLLFELRHRTSNMLSLMQAMVESTARYHDSVDDFRKALATRVFGLAEANARLIESDMGEVSLRSILLQHLTPFCSSEDQLGIDGADVMLAGRKAFDLALIVHEMATNSGKYGALSVESGRVQVTWQENQGALALCWREIGGPKVEPPKTKNFGMRMIEQLAKPYDAASALQFEKDGLIWNFSIPDIRSD